jgi:cytochrome c553
MWRAIILAGAAGLAACSVPVAPARDLAGEEIAFGGGPGGAADACFTCHGLRGEGDGPVPRLAGLSSGYLVKQLEDYAGKWRNDPSMSPIAARLSDADRLAVSSHYAALAVPGVPAEPVAASHETGRILYAEGDPGRSLAACASCHDADGDGFGLASPALRGQTAGYLREQLLAWKDSRRRNDPRDVMGAVARRLSAQEIDALAVYLGSQP